MAASAAGRCPHRWDERVGARALAEERARPRGVLMAQEYLGTARLLEAMVADGFKLHSGQAGGRGLSLRSLGVPVVGDTASVSGTLGEADSAAYG